VNSGKKQKSWFFGFCCMGDE